MDEAQYDLDDSKEPADTCAAVFGDEETSVCQAVSGHGFLSFYFSISRGKSMQINPLFID